MDPYMHRSILTKLTYLFTPFKRKVHKRVGEKLIGGKAMKDPKKEVRKD